LIVLKKLVIMGIGKSRLSLKGCGEMKPIGNNIIAEGKAANSCVEFVKK